MSTLPFTGHCGCGGVRFSIDAAPATVGYCHCTRCQRRTGAAASAQARIDGAHLSILTGEELVCAWQHPNGGFAKLFCSACGSHLFSRSPEDPHQMAVRLGALDPGHGLTPTFRQFCDNAAEWEPIPDDGLERFPGSRSQAVRG